MLEDPTCHDRPPSGTGKMHPLEQEGASVAATYSARLKELLKCQNASRSNPYSIEQRLALAKAYRTLGYPDLAAGDAYKALLLIDEVTEEGEYHEQAVGAALIDVEVHVRLQNPTKDGSREVDQGSLPEATKYWSIAAYDLLVATLMDCGCLRSAFEYNLRALKTFPDLQASSFAGHQETLLARLIRHFESEGESFDAIDIEDYPDKGFVRRELYPWNEYEPDRYSPDVLQLLNDELVQIAPKLEVKVVELPLLSEPSSSEARVRYVKQLGVFAKVDVLPSEQILEEKSLLTAISRFRESYCDACSVSLPNLQNISTHPTAGNTIIACDECEETFFCSKDCYDLAQEKYHPSLCGVDIEQKVSASGAADFLYTLLLVRAIALAETQDLHPLELKEVRYIWGDYHGLDLGRSWRINSDAFGSLPQTLPFSFESNVLRPLHVLEKMDINIFEQSYRFDTWVFNTLYGKLRGTASAQQGLDGRPEVGAVHPMWCLANHSCDPNVAWEWQGSMRFWAREKLVDWEGRNPSKGPGLQKGDEVFSHYCDTTLPAKERREWAIGALGGLCLCPRCVWEDVEGQRIQKDT